MAEVKEIHVEFRKTVSDGNYGNETYSVAYTATMTPEVDALDAGTGAPFARAVELANMARAVVYERLKASPNEGIRSAMETTEEREARYARERQEAKERQERERAEREARIRQINRQVAADADPHEAEFERATEARWGADGDDADDDDDDDETPY